MVKGHSISSKPKFPGHHLRISWIFCCQLISIRNKVPKIPASSSNAFSIYVNLKFHSCLENVFSKIVVISKIFFEKTTSTRFLEMYIMVVLQKNFKFFNITIFQNLSNSPNWIWKCKEKKKQHLLGPKLLLL